MLNQYSTFVSNATLARMLYGRTAAQQKKHPLDLLGLNQQDDEIVSGFTATVEAATSNHSDANKTIS